MSIINPTLENIDLFLDDLMDKNGSDYHSLPVKLDRFILTTYSIIRSGLVYFEASQSINDDIRPLIVEKPDVSIIRDNVLNVWKVPEPADYYRLVHVFPMVDNRKIAREIKIIKSGQEEYENNPFREPTAEYPMVYRMSDFFQINTGSEDNTVYTSAYLKYCKHPTFATLEEPDKRIVNLSLETILRICNETADSFRYTTGDDSAQAVDVFNSKFGKRNRG